MNHENFGEAIYRDGFERVAVLLAMPAVELVLSRKKLLLSVLAHAIEKRARRALLHERDRKVHKRIKSGGNAVTHLALHGAFKLAAKQIFIRFIFYIRKQN